MLLMQAKEKCLLLCYFDTSAAQHRETLQHACNLAFLSNASKTASGSARLVYSSFVRALCFLIICLVHSENNEMFEHCVHRTLSKSASHKIPKVRAGLLHLDILALKYH